MGDCAECFKGLHAAAQPIAVHHEYCPPHAQQTTRSRRTQIQDVEKSSQNEARIAPQSFALALSGSADSDQRLPPGGYRHGQGARKSTGASARQSVAMATPAERSGTSAISLQVRTMGTGNHDVSVPAQVSSNLGRRDAFHRPAAKATHSQAPVFVSM